MFCCSFLHDGVVVLRVPVVSIKSLITLLTQHTCRSAADTGLQRWCKRDPTNLNCLTVVC